MIPDKLYLHATENDRDVLLWIDLSCDAVNATTDTAYCFDFDHLTISRTVDSEQAWGELYF